jgi:hypothetical protein
LVVSPPEEPSRNDASPRSVEDEGRHAAQREAEPTDADIESAIVRAMLGGHGDVATELTRQLKTRRERVAGNVVRMKRGA